LKSVHSPAFLRRAICGRREIFAARTVRCTVLAPSRNSAEDGAVKKYRSILFAAVACVFLSAPFARAGSGWVNDYKKAQEEATANHKFILLDFTGSDWCGWCRKFDKEIWSQPQFKDYARDNLVLVEIDFPRAKPQSVELRKQNQELARQYEIQGFPTIVVLNGNGEKVWQYDGYFPGGLDAFIAELEKLRKG
jgi:protein disulfide-isomerase